MGIANYLKKVGNSKFEPMLEQHLLSGVAALEKENKIKKVSSGAETRWAIV